MSSAARIEELQKKFDENPRRYFAPLANECRKAGDLEAAIAICRAHLPQQPGHMSGHIVYGQALFEAGELDEARTVFETALGLDPENLIALRHMGDIAARNGDIDGARQWYTRVVETDPRNEEVQALLAGLGAEPSVAEPMAAGPTAEGDLPTFIEPALIAAAAEAAPEPVDTTSGGGDELVFVEGTESYSSESPAAVEPSEELLDFEPTSFGAAPSAPSAMDVPPAIGLEPEPPSVSADSLTLDGFEATSFETTSFEAPADEAPPNEPAPLDLDATGFGATGLEPTSLAIPGAAPEPDAFVTETMAELYLQQGYPDRALDVYRQLVAQNPGDAGLRERMAHVEREGTAAISESFATEEIATGEPELIDEPIELPGATAEPEAHGLPTAMEPALVAAAAEVEAVGTAAAPVGPTIREFLAAVARGEGVPEGTGAAAGEAFAVEDPAAMPSLAFPDVPEVSAPIDGGRDAVPAPEIGGEIAEVVAVDAVVTPEPEQTGAPLAPRGGEGLDTIFGAPARTDDVNAANVLADAYAPLPPSAAAPAAPAASETQANPLSGRPARPAGNELSLDHVFGQPRTSGPTKPTGSFSFDQFFAEGAVKSPREDAPEPERKATEEDDIEQFNNWLKSLKSQ